MILSRNAFDRLAKELQATVDEKNKLLVVPVVVDYDDWRGTVAAGFPYDDNGCAISLGEYAVEATVLEVDDALEGADVPEPGETFDPGDGINLRHEIRGGRPGWLCVSDWFCDFPAEFDSIEDFVDAMEEAFGFRPVLDDFLEDVARIRYYDTPEGRVVEGEEGFDRDEWLASGANWEKVLERI